MNNPEIRINGRKIGVDSPPYVIAEMSANHNGKLENALLIIEKAYKAGADAIKIQTYKPETITLQCDNDEFLIKSGKWAGRTLFDLYAEAHLPWEWHKPIFEHARSIGITLFSSPFDSTAVDLLEDLNAPAYKIASFEAIDLPLIKYVASTHKPMIISTGMASKEEIGEAIDAAKSSGCKELAVLHCVSGYPAPVNEYNLKTINSMIELFGLVTGLSDHTLENTTAITSIAMGASIIEKHFTLDRNGGGPDDSFSLEPTELKNLCYNLKIAWKSVGNVNYGLMNSEKDSIIHRRSLYIVKDMIEGEFITLDCVRSVRPGNGLPPKYLDSILGKRLKKSKTKNTPLKIEDIDGL